MFFTVLFVLMVEIGTTNYFYDPMIIYDTLEACLYDKALFEYTYPDYVFLCEEYIDV